MADADVVQQLLGAGLDGATLRVWFEDPVTTFIARYESDFFDDDEAWMIASTDAQRDPPVFANFVADNPLGLTAVVGRNQDTDRLAIQVRDSASGQLLDSHEHPVLSHAGKITSDPLGSWIYGGHTDTDSSGEWFVVKVSADFGAIWAKTAPMQGGNSLVHELRTDDDGHVYMVATTGGTITVSKYAP